MAEGDTVGGGMLKTLLKGTTWQALGQFLPLIINLALTPYIIEGLGAKIYGIFLLINNTIDFGGRLDLNLALTTPLLP